MGRFVNFCYDIIVINMAAMGPCVTFSGIHCTLPGCRLADLYENYIAKAYNISVPGMVDSFLKAIARDVTFIIEFCSSPFFFLPFQFCLILFLTC